MRTRHSLLLGFAATALGLLLAQSAFAAEPIKRVDIFVEPYYASANSTDGAPTVAVGDTYSGLLASTDKNNVVAARDKVIADPGLVTPMTMMVLAIRLYDFGLRDDAAFWFYAAKDRFVTLARVVDIDAAGLAGVQDAIKNFATLAGPVINGYAYCDPANQTAIRARALKWVEENPYGVLLMEQLPARADDRQATLATALAALHADAEKERAYLEDAQNLASFKAKRAENEMDDRFCWK
jgi:hypothetical protein